MESEPEIPVRRFYPPLFASNLLRQTVAFAVLAAFTAFFLAIFWGFHGVCQRWVDGGDQPNTPPNYAPKSVVVRVTGPSMAPTLWGPHAEVVCHTCQVRWKIHWQPEHRPRATITCWNCGAAVPCDQAEELPGDDVTVIPLSPDPLRRGELVAIAESPEASRQRPTAWVVKRIAAVPGQSIAHKNGWLYADDRPLEAVDSAGEPIWINVHDDAFRPPHDSRWKPRGDRYGIETHANGFGFDADQRITDWVDYHHQAVHNAMRPDVIRDDVPGNAAESRALTPVDSVAISIESEASAPAELEVHFRIAEKTSVLKRTVPPNFGRLWLRSEDAVDLAGDGPPAEPEPFGREASTTTPNLPISIRLIAGRLTLKKISVWRPLRYRIDPRIAAKQDWPIRLLANQYYLLGDNVPLSIDSRHWGPISEHRIVGRIYTVGYDNR